MPENSYENEAHAPKKLRSLHPVWFPGTCNRPAGNLPQIATADIDLSVAYGLVKTPLNYDGDTMVKLIFQCKPEQEMFRRFWLVSSNLTAIWILIESAPILRH